MNKKQAFAKYLNQFAELEVYKETSDDNGKPLFNSPKTIRCRIKSHLQNVVSQTGYVVTCNYVVITQADVKAGDRINGRIVEGVSDYLDIDGSVVGKRVVT